jgi:hypothetical protein
MSANLPTLFSQQYSSNVAFLSQQRLSRFQSAVSVASGYQGKQVSPVDQVGAVSMQPVNSRFQTKVRTDAAVDRRWVVPQSFDLQQLEDSVDKLKMISDVRSAYVQNTVAAANRQKDDLVISAFFGTSPTGETGGTSTTFPTSTSTNTVSVSYGATTSDLSVAKLKKAVELLLNNNVDLDLEEVYCAIGPKQNTALLNEIEIIGNDFRSSERPTVDAKGRVMEFMGIRFLHTNRLSNGTDDAAGTSRGIPLWCKSGMHLGLWQDNQYRVRQAEEFKGNPWEVYAYMTAGATRVEEAKVIRIWAREA